MKDKSKHGIDFKERGGSNVMKPENVVGEKNVMNCKEMNKALAVHYSRHGFDILNRQGNYPIKLDVIDQSYLTSIRAKAIKATKAR